MSLTLSNMMPLGTQAPSFTLPDVVTGTDKSLEDLKSSLGTVVMFICNHCPFVIHVQDEVVRLAKEYQARGFAFIAISSNDVTTHPDDAPARMKELAIQKDYSFPYLYDESQEVARAYQAACTPDFYVFDADLRCVYRGQLDDARPGNETPVTGRDLRAALDAVLAGQPVDAEQRPSSGCNIKWKAA